MSMGVDGVGGVGTTTDAASGAASRVPGKTMGQQDFLKLLVTQLSAQDPMNPQKDTEFIAQMAQFSALEQTRSMQADIAGLRSDQQLLQANSLIGRTVAVKDTASGVITGTVTGLTVSDGATQVIINGTPYALGKVLGVSQPNPS